MSFVIVYRFDDVDEEMYWAVNDAIGVDRDFTQNLPDGLLVHSAGPVGDGGWVVSEVWTSKDAYEVAFARLGEALGAVGVPPPAQVIESDTVSSHLLG
jgi:hypothetical protein